MYLQRRTLGESPPASKRCAAAGGFYTVFPRGHPKAGQPACRTRARDGTLRYADALTLPEHATANIEAAWDWTGDAAVNAANLANDAARAALRAPRELVADVLGVPPFVVTALALGVGYLLLRPYLVGGRDTGGRG